VNKREKVLKVKFEALMAMKMQVSLFCDVTSYSPIDRYQNFGRTFGLLN
jgi:hypothetical protein